VPEATGRHSQTSENTMLLYMDTHIYIYAPIYIYA